MTPVRTIGNLRGSRIESVIGITRPMPSNENTAVLKDYNCKWAIFNSGQSIKYSPNQEREILLVEPPYRCNASFYNDRHLVPSDIHDPGENKDVRDKRGKTQFSKIPYHGERKKDDELRED